MSQELKIPEVPDDIPNSLKVLHEGGHRHVERFEAAQAHLAKLASDRYDQLLQKERELIDARADSRQLYEALRMLSFASDFVLERADEAQHCGDHCRNSCIWCDIRERNEQARAAIRVYESRGK